MLWFLWQNSLENEINHQILDIQQILIDIQSKQFYVRKIFIAFIPTKCHVNSPEIQIPTNHLVFN